ncbi:hypothetical protein E2C01_030797 [Portunus trituberculatus]|uniref:Uncharacterized protein n=1 Tax=Portunus trituberculatus TaxID=210409 RepID=A0A5B7EWS9_PORTR|nr:hypothetical protein [Portunus trituberculatus]
MQISTNDIVTKLVTDTDNGSLYPRNQFKELKRSNG